MRVSIIGVTGCKGTRVQAAIMQRRRSWEQSRAIRQAAEVVVVVAG